VSDLHKKVYLILRPISIFLFFKTASEIKCNSLMLIDIFIRLKKIKQ